MSYDIYGNTLQAGHCEVHPHVHCTYPCPCCYDDAAREQQAKDYYEQAMKEQYEQYCEEMLAERIEELQGMYGDGI